MLCLPLSFAHRNYHTRRFLLSFSLLYQPRFPTPFLPLSYPFSVLFYPFSVLSYPFFYPFSTLFYPGSNLFFCPGRKRGRKRVEFQISRDLQGLLRNRLDLTDRARRVTPLREDHWVACRLVSGQIPLEREVFIF